MAVPPHRTNRKVFIDSSVFFAAAYSTTGSAHDLLQASLQGRVTLVLSALVLAETERNILENAPTAHPAFIRFQQSLVYQLSQPSQRLMTHTAKVVARKDAAIVAGARAARAHWLASYDRRHLLTKRAEIQAAFGITVATPEEILRLLLAHRTKQ